MHRLTSTLRMWELSTGAEYVAPVDPVVPNDHAPEFDYGFALVQKNENIDTTEVIWNASATDGDGDVLTYSLGGGDTDAFESRPELGAVN